MRRPVPLTFALVGLLLPVLAAPGAADIPPAHKANGPQPVHGVQTMQLEEMWRVGGESDEENFFGLVTWAEAGDDGLVYVLDTQLCQVNVYDREGNLVRILFRQGEGPGEVQRPRDLVLLPDGRIGAVQEFPGKIVCVDAAGDPAPSITPRTGETTAGGFIAMTAAETRAGTFIVAGVSISIGDNNAIQKRTTYLATVGEDGLLGTRFEESAYTWDFSNFTYDEAVYLPSFIWAHAVGPDGRIYTAPDRNAYRINVYAPDGTLEQVIEREYESWQRTAEDRAWVTALFEGAFRNVPFEFNLKMADTESDIHWLNRGLQVADDGEIWVLPSRGTRNQPAGVVATFDVFTPDGTFDRQVQVACPGNGAKDGLFLLDAERVMLVKGYTDAVAAMFGGAGVETEDEDAAPMELVCYRIVE